MTEEQGPLPSGDFYYHGTILKVRYGSGTGILKTGNGRRIPFTVPFVEFMNFRRIEELADGMTVGYDVGWTSRGLRVTKLKIY